MRLKYENVFKEIQEYFIQDFLENNGNPLTEVTAPIIWEFLMDRKNTATTIAYLKGNLKIVQQGAWVDFFKIQNNETLRGIMSSHKKGKCPYDSLPIEIQQEMMERQFLQWGSYDEERFRQSITGGFSWSDTVEGHSFWSNILTDFNYMDAMLKFVTKKLPIDESKYIIL